MAYSQLKTFTEPLSILINLRDNRYRCLDLTDPRTTTSVRTTSTSVPALSSHQVSAVTNKVSRLLTLSRMCAPGGARLSWFGNSRGQRSGSKHTGTLVVPSLSSRRNTSRGHRWVARLLTFRTTVTQDPMAVRQSQPRVEYKDYSLIAHT